MSAFRVLLVGDAHAPALSACAKGLQRYGLDTISAEPHSGASAAKRLRPDVVIVDLPSACDAARRLKADSSTAQIPVVAMGEATRHQIDMGARAHCDAFVSKPFLAEELVACVKALICDAARSNAQA